MKEKTRIVKKTEKQFHRMIKYLQKKDLFDVYPSLWRDELSDKRFLLWPKLWKIVRQFWDAETVSW